MTSILDIASKYTSLTLRGKRHWGICPLHQEETASFTVDPEKGVWYCFGCSTGGDVVELIARIERISRGEAHKLLNANGVQVRTRSGFDNALWDTLGQSFAMKWRAIENSFSNKPSRRQILDWFKESEDIAKEFFKKGIFPRDMSGGAPVEKKYQILATATPEYRKRILSLMSQKATHDKRRVA